MTSGLKRFLINIIACFIFSKKKRRKFRMRLGLNGVRDNFQKYIDDFNASLPNFAQCNFVTLAQARKMGYTEFFLGWTGMGDQVMILSFCQNRYRKTGIKTLVSAAYPEFFMNDESCLVLSDLPGQYVFDLIVYEARNNLAHYDMTVHGFRPLFLNHHHDIRPDKVLCFPMHGHIIKNISCLHGLAGDIEIKTRLKLTEDELKFGRFSKNKVQIAIMCGGVHQYKKFSKEKAEAIINMLKGEFDFVQIGGPTDEMLSGCIQNLHQSNLSFRKAAAILANSDLYVGAIGGLMHLANAVSCPSVILYSAEPVEMEDYAENTNIFSDTPCDLCPTGKIMPIFETCPFSYKCMTGIKAEKVVDAIRKRLVMPREISPYVQFVTIAEDSAQGLQLLIEHLTPRSVE